MELLKEYFVLWVISNSVAILLLIIAIKKTKLARLLFAILFAWACWINYTTAHNNPDDYLEYASMTPFSLYVDFINSWFKENITTMVSLISFGQGLIAIGMILKGWFVRLACIGAIVFFFAITPLSLISHSNFSGKGSPSSAFKIYFFILFL